MKWKFKTVPTPKSGAYRVIKRFALFPRIIRNDTIVWLEYYYKEQTYYMFGAGFDISSSGWVTFSVSSEKPV
jgi:hypothetical protein